MCIPQTFVLLPENEKNIAPFKTRFARNKPNYSFIQHKAKSNATSLQVHLRSSRNQRKKVYEYIQALLKTIKLIVSCRCINQIKASKNVTIYLILLFFFFVQMKLVYSLIHIQSVHLVTGSKNMLLN